MKHYSTQELLEITKNVPSVVQDAFSSDTTISTIEDLGGRYQLHIDQIGLLAELNIQMLLGLVTPQEFLQELVKAQIAEADAKQIISDINQKIFVPLREEMRKGGKSALEPTPPTTAPGLPRVQVPVPPATVRAPTPGAGAPAGSPSTKSDLVLGEPGHFHLENKLPNYPAQQVKPVEETRKLLEDHEEPHIDIKMDKTAVPPNLPGVLHPAEALRKGGTQPPAQEPIKPAPKVEPIAPTPPAPAPAPDQAPVPMYSIDPYREPIEP